MSSSGDELPHILENTKSIEAENTITSTEIETLEEENVNILQKQYLLIRQSSVQSRWNEKTNYHINKTTRHWILRISFLLFIALGFAISFIEIRYSTYSLQNNVLTTGDQVLFPVSTYLNKQVQINSNSNDNDNMILYVLQQMPNISSEVSKYECGVQFRMPSWTFQYWGFYLLSGTSVKISVCADLQVQFYILRGEKKLKSWMQQILYNSYDYHSHIFPKSSCNKISSFKSHILTISESDYYFILFSTSNGWRFFTEVSALLQFNRTYYDLSDLKYMCVLSNKSCIANLDEASNDISLIEAALPSKAPYLLTKNKLEYIPIARYSFYLKYFGGMYLSIAILLISYTLVRVSMKRHDTSLEKEPLLSSTVPDKQYLSEQNPWVVISNITRLSSENTTCMIEEHDTNDILGDKSLDNFRNDSTSSQNFMRQQNETSNYGYSNMYDNSQQLLDTCLTSAGASAI